MPVTRWRSPSARIALRRTTSTGRLSASTIDDTFVRGHPLTGRGDGCLSRTPTVDGKHAASDNRAGDQAKKVAFPRDVPALRQNAENHRAVGQEHHECHEGGPYAAFEIPRTIRKPKMPNTRPLAPMCAASRPSSQSAMPLSSAMATETRRK